MTASSRLESILAKIEDFEVLPTYQEAVELFQICGSSRILEIAFSSHNISNLFQVFNLEFVDALADEIRKMSGKPILEIGAGDGKLAHHLRKRGIPVEATDDYSLFMPRDPSRVRNLTHIKALEEYNPEIVVASWVRNIVDDVMAFLTVNHLILIYSSRCCVPDYRFTYQAPQRRNFHQTSIKSVMQFGVCSGDYYPNGMNNTIVLHLERMEKPYAVHSRATKTSLPSTFT